MGLENIKLGLTDTETAKTLADGTELVVERVAGTVASEWVDPVAFHEACHALAGILLNLAVYSATDIPGPGYLGATFLGDYHPTVAAAAEAMGCAGTGHDMWSIWATGHDPQAAVSNARSLLSGHHYELKAIATAIHESGSASGSEMVDAKTRVNSDLVKVTWEKNGVTRTEYKTLLRGSTHITPPIELPQQ